MKKIGVRGPLIGCDISHHNVPFSRFFGDFQIHKATEGVSFVDSDFSLWCEECQTLKGAYHFASKFFDRNYIVETDHFIYTLEKNKFKGIMVLDLEGVALDCAIKDPSKAIYFMKEVYRSTGVTPFLYSNFNGTNMLSTELSIYPLWIASYNKTDPSIADRFEVLHTKIFDRRYLIWQFINKPFDLDIANMTVEEWEKYSVDFS